MNSRSGHSLNTTSQSQMACTGLSPIAPEFFPSSQRNMSSIPEEQTAVNILSGSSDEISSSERTDASLAASPKSGPSPPMDASTFNPSTPRRGPNGLLIYDNGNPNIPSHWIPIYGAGHGMFFDPATKLFHGDGIPRLTVERDDGSMPENEASRPRLIRPWDHPDDAAHIQPQAFVNQVLAIAPSSRHDGHRLFFCTCTGSWLWRPHDCMPQFQAVDELPSGALPAIRPGQVLPKDWVTHEIPIVNARYLEDEEAAKHAALAAFTANRHAEASMCDDLGADFAHEGTERPEWYGDLKDGQQQNEAVVNGGDRSWLKQGEARNGSGQTRYKKRRPVKARKQAEKKKR